MSSHFKSVLAAAGFLLLAVGGPARAGSGEESLQERLRVFNDVLRLVRANYVEEVNAPELVDGAITGLLRELDPHSNYLDPKRFEQTSERNRGEYEGIGISFAIRDGHVTVISAIEGTPCDRLGIRPGDRIVKIDGAPAIGINEDEVFERLRGPEGTTVHVAIQRPGAAELLEFDIVRERIPIKSVPYWFMLDRRTGYIRMIRFSATTGEEIERAIDQLEGVGMQQLLLDLRGNPGGYLEQAVEVADKFIDSDRVVVYTKGRIHGASEEHRASGRSPHPRFPLIVLINHGSASASEIVAGALQDWDRGLVVGQTSFGKGLVQRQYRLRDGSALFLTVGRYYTPSGRLIQREYGRDRVSYYAEGYDDVDPNADVDSTLAERPLYRTAAGRPVFGGGGITPDVRLEPVVLSTAHQALERANVPFAFASEHIAQTGFAYPAGFERFLAEYELDDAGWESFLAFATTADLEVTPEELAAERDAIAQTIKREIAGYLWGPTARYRVLIANDAAVEQARDHFGQAGELLALHAAAGQSGGDATLSPLHPAGERD